MSDDEIVLSFEDSLLRRCDLMLIQNNGWINDSIITFWFEYLTHVKYKEFASRVSLIGPEVTQLIKSADSSDSGTSSFVTSMLQSMSLSEKQLILLPINDHSSRSSTAGGSHWTLIAITKNSDGDAFSFFHLDSLSTGFNDHAAKQILRVIRNVITIQNEILTMDCVSQSNSYDCGVHVMVNADALCQKVLLNDERKLNLIASCESIRDMRPFLLCLIRDLSSKTPFS